MEKKRKITELCETWLKGVHEENSHIGIEEQSSLLHIQHSTITDTDQIIAMRLKRKSQGQEREEQPKRMKLGKWAEMVLDIYCEWMDCYHHATEYREFLEHMKKHESGLLETVDEKNITSYTCMWDLCKFTSPNLRELRRHVGFHAYQKKLKAAGTVIRDHFSAPRCDYDSSKRNDLPKMLYDFRCMWTDCGSEFLYVQDYYDHVSSHLLAVDPNNKRLHCGWLGCQYSGANRTRLSEHVMTHTKERKLACPHCGVAFFNYLKYLEHCDRQIPVTDQDYQCTKCNKLFPTEKLMRMHVLHHVNSYQCSFCEMTTISMSALALHIRDRHISTKAFNCNQCNYKTSRKYAFNRHVKTIHEGIKQWKSTKNKIYACHCCEKEYRTASALSNHLRSLHGYRLPPGFTRFRYELQEDGTHKLQQIRYESTEISKQTVPEDVIKKMDDDSANYQLLKFKDICENSPAQLKILQDDDDNNDNPPTRLPDELKRNKKKNHAKFKQKMENMVHKDIEISIQDLDSDGNVIKERVVQTQGLLPNHQIIKTETVTIGYDDITIDEHHIKNEITISETDL